MEFSEKQINEMAPTLTAMIVMAGVQQHRETKNNEELGDMVFRNALEAIGKIGPVTEDYFEGDSLSEKLSYLRSIMASLKIAEDLYEMVETG